MRFCALFLLFSCHSPSAPSDGKRDIPGYFSLDYADQHECVTHTFHDGRCLVTRIICRDSEFATAAKCQPPPDIKHAAGFR